MDVGVAYGSLQTVGLGCTGEVGLQFQIYIKVGAYEVLLREHSMVGVELHALQADVHVGCFHNG